MEEEALGCSHGEIGGYRLGLWGLPTAVIEAVAFHHRPRAGAPGALQVVHLANALLQEDPQLRDQLLDRELLRQNTLRSDEYLWLALRDETCRALSFA